MDFHGHINLQENEMQQMAFGAETDFPVTPVVGRMVFKDSILYMCVALNNVTPIWIPINSFDSYHHTQNSTSTTWIIIHNLSSFTPAVKVYDVFDNVVIPDAIISTNENTTTISFNTAVAGKAIITKGDELPVAGIGVLSPDLVAYTEHFTSSSTIVSKHNLGYYPVVRVYEGTTEIQPTNITHDSIYQVTVTFSTNKTGTLRMV